MDRLQPERFEAISQGSSHAQVLEDLRTVTEAGFTQTKIDSVVMRGVNDDELVDLIEFSKTVAAEVRFTEYMDVGGATAWDPALVFSGTDMRQRLTENYGEIEALAKTDSSPASRIVLQDGTMLGIISSTTRPFCALFTKWVSVVAGEPLVAHRAWGMEWLERQRIILLLADRLGVDPAEDLRPGVLTATLMGAADCAVQVWVQDSSEGVFYELTEEALELAELGPRRIAIRSVR